MDEKRFWKEYGKLETKREIEKARHSMKLHEIDSQIKALTYEYIRKDKSEEMISGN